jgi:hypothetical protein
MMDMMIPGNTLYEIASKMAKYKEMDLKACLEVPMGDILLPKINDADQQRRIGN